MSLVRLLTTGKSLVGLNSATARYEMRRKNLLPKFISSKNPFTKTTIAEAARVAAPVAPQKTLPLTPAEQGAAALKSTERLPIMNTNVNAQENAAPKAPRGWSRWLSALNPLNWWKRKPAKSAIPRFNKAPVQAELSLDKIKVVRNDLSEADVEVVPRQATVVKARAAAVPPTAAMVAPAEPELQIPDLPPATRSWELLGERIMAK